MSGNHLELDAGMNKKVMLGFLFYNGYVSLAGFAGILVGIIAWIFAGLYHTKLGVPAIAVLILIGCMFLLLKPGMLYIQAGSIMKNESCYRKPMHYSFDSQGIVITQDNENEFLSWNKVKKMVLTASMLAIYDTKQHAFILPLSEAGEEKERLLALIRQAASENKWKFKDFYKNNER